MQPFTKEEAIDIAEDFEDLKDTGLAITVEADDIEFLVLEVTIAPFAEKEQQQFIEQYKTNGNIDACVNNYSGEDYDVLILGRNYADDSIVHFDIRTYTNAYRVRYNYP
jgi:hypothetical protein